MECEDNLEKVPSICLVSACQRQELAEDRILVCGLLVLVCGGQVSMVDWSLCDVVWPLSWCAEKFITIIVWFDGYFLLQEMSGRTIWRLFVVPAALCGTFHLRSVHSFLPLKDAHRFQPELCSSSSVINDFVFRRRVSLHPNLPSQNTPHIFTRPNNTHGMEKSPTYFTQTMQDFVDPTSCGVANPVANLGQLGQGGRQEQQFQGVDPMAKAMGMGMTRQSLLCSIVAVCSHASVRKHVWVCGCVGGRVGVWVCGCVGDCGCV